MRRPTTTRNRKIGDVGPNGFNIDTTQHGAQAGKVSSDEVKRVASSGPLVSPAHSPNRRMLPEMHEEGVAIRQTANERAVV